MSAVVGIVYMGKLSHDPKIVLDLDGFIREIGRRQKSFDLRQKFVWYKSSKSNPFLVEKGLIKS